MHSWKFAGLALIQAALLAATLQTAAYAGDTPTEAPRRVAVMTMNMYLGANVNPVFAVENPRDLPGVVADVWDQFLRTNVAERVKAMAALIRALRPDFIGVQEAALIRIQTPSDFFSPNRRPAEHVAYDFVALLLNALKQSRLSYRAVARSQNFDIEVPRANPNGTLTDVRVTDRDVVLARGDVKVDPRSIIKRNYNAAVTVGSMRLLRGFVAIDAVVGGTTYRFVTTHLEAGSQSERVRVAQVRELIREFEDESLPLIVVADFNSEAPAGSAYLPMLDAGYADVWTARVGAPAEGLTCCQDSDLLNQDSLLHERIDLIFARNIGLQRVVARTGLDKPGQKTASGLWPSDHAAVFASLLGQGLFAAAMPVPAASGLAASEAIAASPVMME
jgi:endonuclease/exonuclease/phosphatase family metal-dependent hydrolase